MDDLALVRESELGRKVTAAAARCRTAGLWLGRHALLLEAEVYDLPRQYLNHPLSLFGRFGVRVLGCQMICLLLLNGGWALRMRLALQLKLLVCEIGQDLFRQRLIH